MQQCLCAHEHCPAPIYPTTKKKQQKRSPTRCTRDTKRAASWNPIIIAGVSTCSDWYIKTMLYIHKQRAAIHTFSVTATLIHTHIHERDDSVIRMRYTAEHNLRVYCSRGFSWWGSLFGVGYARQIDGIEFYYINLMVCIRQAWGPRSMLFCLCMYSVYSLVWLESMWSRSLVWVCFSLLTLHLCCYETNQFVCCTQRIHSPYIHTWAWTDTCVL